MSNLERKWWFFAPVTCIGAWLTIQLLSVAGMPIGALSISQWLVFALCFFGIQRGLSFAGWLIFLTVAPKLAKQGA
ncbi:hypothetical protein [Paucibacter sp. KCTC 42545]|uniref:hypothetical protein n=1 Tax=Paucibacter sp. KCTC 42545 TaxID=1768242 RepID=UPI000733AF28|nr:hypothetical protein [Paucibacter sp. KCTC 42545]ALT76292.1 hypothetical protein AT984_02805 [Paucibacter sp. KCTC 42545]